MCIVVTVAVPLLFAFFIAISKTFKLLFSSVSSMKFSFGGYLLMYWCSCLVHLLFPWYTSNMSSKYLHQYMILWFCICICYMWWIHSCQSAGDRGSHTLNFRLCVICFAIREIVLFSGDADDNFIYVSVWY